MHLDEITRTLQSSADLMKRWGDSGLPDGRRLKDLFSYEGVSLWDAAAVVVALHHLPRALHCRQSPAYAQQLMTLLRICKYEFIDRRHYLSKNKRGNWPSTPVFLFLGFQPYMYRDTIMPIARKMADDPGTPALSLSDYLSLEERNAGQGIRSQSVWEHWDKGLRDEARKLTALSNRSFKELKGLRILPQIIQNEGKPLWPRMRGAFDWLFAAYFPYLIKHLVLARHILTAHRPRAIISTDVSDPRNRIYALLARHLNIPTLEVQFGVYEQAAVEWQFFSGDRVAVWGETSRDTLIAHGIESKRLILTGSPRHDSLAAVSKSEILRARAALGIPEGKKLALFASTYATVYDRMGNSALLDSVKQAVFQAAGRNKGICLLVKPHPNEKVSATKKLASGCGTVFADRKADIKKLIMACDIFISLGSTSTMDAIIADKLTICPNFPGWKRSDLFVESGAVLAPGSPDELRRCLEEMSGDGLGNALARLKPAREQFLKKWIFETDGKASIRIKELLSGFVKDANSQSKTEEVPCI